MREGATPQSVIEEAASDLSGVGEDREEKAYRGALAVRLFAEETLVKERTAPLRNTGAGFAPDLSLGEDGRVVPWEGLDAWASERGEGALGEISDALDGAYAAAGTAIELGLKV